MLPVQNHKHTPAHPEGFTVTFKNVCFDYTLERSRVEMALIALAE